MIRIQETAAITDKIIVLEDNKKIEAVALGNEKEINEEYAKSDYNMLSICGKKKYMANITLFKEILDERKKHFLNMKNYVQKDINHQFGVLCRDKDIKVNNTTITIQYSLTQSHITNTKREN
ncbi:hypothetical protein RFI_01674 [Reticulomyxa filosa]|uniref:Uncharacterized protein n=1 Tax=Reticulomyxa filosa TaxID=46433 RepID=X6PBA2_RETFI|nr:hypothetical protein RFI_01674 [Reticulomyxa filosa]|eukprot:ETO35388.1 hypothetical protein RFI_01674 [Reticulomyxa filosa]